MNVQIWISKFTLTAVPCFEQPAHLLKTSTERKTVTALCYKQPHFYIYLWSNKMFREITSLIILSSTSFETPLVNGLLNKLPLVHCYSLTSAFISQSDCRIWDNELLFLLKWSTPCNHSCNWPALVTTTIVKPCLKS